MQNSETAGRPLILILEDNQELAELYEIVLSSQGYAVTSASNGKMGLGMVERLAPDLVILDMMMPEMDGLEFLDELPRHASPAPPVIANSGFEAFESQARALGARAFLTKPVTADELVAAVARVLAGREDPTSERAHKQRITSQRAEAHRAREQFWAKVDIENTQLRSEVEGLVAWFIRYLGFGTGLVDLLREDKVCVYVGPDAVKRSVFDRPSAFCSDVVDAGSSLLIPDTKQHRVFSDHPAVACWNTRFYAGCPITIGSGLVLGTICVIDTVPRTFQVIDMRLLVYLAGRVGELLQANAERRAPSTTFFVPPALFGRSVLEDILAMELEEKPDLELLVATFPSSAAGSDEPGVLPRAAAAVHEVTSGMKVLSAHLADRTLAILCAGDAPSEAERRSVEALRRVTLSPKAIGVATYRSALSPDVPRPSVVTAEQLISAARSACTRSAQHDGAPVSTVMGRSAASRA